LAFAGSARRDSFNKKLIRVAAAGAEEAGVATTLVDLRDFPLPLYDGDLEAAEGLPPNAAKLKELFLSHQGLLIAAPEYNSSITPLLKNTIDWVSRSHDASPDLAPYRGKVAALMAASPGALGGLRGLVALRTILGNIGVTVIPDQIAIREAHAAFGDEGALSDPKQAARVRALGGALASWVRKLPAE
jgi:NAD(P)H-dependent FMN reductase